jgi:hypothetical protein
MMETEKRFGQNGPQLPLTLPARTSQIPTGSGSTEVSIEIITSETPIDFRLQNEKHEPSMESDIEKGLQQAKGGLVTTTPNNAFSSESLPKSSVTEVDGSDLIDWEGADDPNDPQNWKLRRKWWAIALGKSFTFQIVVQWADFIQYLHLLSCLLWRHLYWLQVSK